MNVIGHKRRARDGPPMFFRSLFYERNVLMYLARVQQLPPEVQAQIAKRVGNFIELAKPVSDDLLPRFGEAAREEKDVRSSWGLSLTRTRYGLHPRSLRHGAMQS